MSLAHASRHVGARASCLRSSYVEISRFFRTRRHGITPARAQICSERAGRCFSGSRVLKDAIEPDEKLRKALDEFKDTSKSSRYVISSTHIDGKQYQ
jgi:aspartyl-tRNA synthetase